MKKSDKKLLRIIKRDESGYTLLEYCAGAAVIAGVLWIALSGLGDQITNLLERIGQWASNRADQVESVDRN